MICLTWYYSLCFRSWRFVCFFPVFIISLVLVSFLFTIWLLLLPPLFFFTPMSFFFSCIYFAGTGQASAPILPLSRLQRPVVLINSRLGLLSAAPRCFGGELLHTQGRSFSRSYGSNLPSSLTKVLPFPLWYLPSPTSVGLRYGRNCN